MNQNWVRQQVAHYLEVTQLPKGEFAKQAGVSDRTVRRLLHSNRSISEPFLLKLMSPIQTFRFKVVGLKSGKTYYRGEHRSDCIRWINDQSVQSQPLRSLRRNELNIKEPMLIQRLPSAS